MVDIFSAPIPGQSLTKPKGGAPYEHPSRFSDIDEALEYIFDELTFSKTKSTQLLAMLSKGAPAEALARTILMAGFMGGMWTVDMALMMGPTVMYMIAAIGHKKGIKVKIRVPNRSHEKTLASIAKINPEQSKSVKALTTTPKTGPIFEGLI